LTVNKIILKYAKDLLTTS